VQNVSHVSESLASLRVICGLLIAQTDELRVFLILRFFFIQDRDLGVTAKSFCCGFVGSEFVAKDMGH
jgi:hypothetical protein